MTGRDTPGEVSKVALLQKARLGGRQKSHTLTQQHWNVPGCSDGRGDGPGDRALAEGERLSERGDHDTLILSLSRTHGKPAYGSSPLTTTGPGCTTFAQTHSLQNVKREKNWKTNTPTNQLSQL